MCEGVNPPGRVWKAGAQSAKKVLLLLVTLLCASWVSAAPGPKSESIEFWDDSEPASRINLNHSVWQSILDTYLDDAHSSGINRFDYASVSAVDLQRLTDYLDYLQSMEPRQLNKPEQMAYWVNLYNAKIVQLVISSYADNDEISSIRQIRSGVFTPGPWERNVFVIAQQKLSLDDVEHGVLRPHWNDYRIHYVLNCASLGCPNLLKTAFDGDNNEALLEKAEKEFLSHARAVRVDDGELVLSSLFDWHRSDFASDKTALLDYLRSHIEPALGNAIGSADGPRFEYDWALNKPD